ncbi:DNRLRE domain-containing protein [Streptomyces melanogenes]|uniref:DNRLRE domain-containing protein n=1 Tax=Streptomyces melanogenes TaxID=67326 RepID=UPI00379EC0F8
MRLLALALAAVLGVTLLVDPETAFAAPSKPERSTSSAQRDSPVHDLASARLAAKLRGRRVEVLGARTEASTTWANPDGTLTTQTAAGPIRFRRAGGWDDVDVAFAKRPDGSVASKAHPRGLALSGPKGVRAPSFAAAAQSPAQDLLSLSAGSKRVSLQWRGGLPEPRVDRAKATYADVLPHADLVIDATRTGYEQSLVLKQRPAESPAFTLYLKAPGVTARQQPDGSVLFAEATTGRALTQMPAPVMWDDTVDPRSLEHTRKARVGLKVIQSGDGIALRLTPDAGFLADPATKFPVTVDPSDTVLSDVFDAFVQQGDTADESNSTDLKLGWPGDYADPPTNAKPRVARSFITWDMAPIKDALVSKATLSLFNYHSWDCTKPTSWEVWDTGTPKTTTRWTAQPTWYQKYATSTETRGNNCSSAGWVNADVTSLLQYWAGQTGVTKEGLGLRATNEGNVLGWKKFYSGNAATSQIPKLSVTYNYRPRAGTDQQAGPPFFAFDGAYVVNTTTPTLRDTFTDTNNDQVDGTFQIYDGAADTQIGNLLVSPYGPSGEPVSVTVPAGLLENGKTYRFRTNPYDGLHYNLGWSAWKYFAVDTSAPSAPASVTSADYPSTGWVKGVGQAGTFTVTPPATDHQWIEWSQDTVTWTKVPTSGAGTPVSFQVTPTEGGTNTLLVRTVDRADNKSEPVSYVFHVGSGGIVSVDDTGARTAAQLRLVAEADGAKFDRVSFAWRRSDADAWAPLPPAHVTAGGQPLSAWPVPMSAGRNAPLVWNVLNTVSPEGEVQLKADFTGPGGATGSSERVRVLVDHTAQGAATTEIGGGTANLLTGDFTLAATDLSVFEVKINRHSSSLRSAAGESADQAQIFGKEWSSGVVAEVGKSTFSHIRKLSTTAVEVVDVDGETIQFTANAAQNGWVPQSGAESTTLTGSLNGEFKLTTDYGSVITFAKPSPAAETWQATTVMREGQHKSGTRVVSETVSTGGKELARPKRVIAPTSAVTASTCEADPAARGCRVIEFSYADTTTATSTTFGDFTGHVRELRVWATAPGASASTPTIVATYAYDVDGRLRESWDPRITPALKTAYAYDRAGRVSDMTPPGQLPYTYTYGTAGHGTSDGMLLKVARPTLQPGSVDQTSGTAVTSLVYGVPLSGPKAPFAMGSGDVATWGQTDAPSEATAIFPADAVPASATGDNLSADSYTRAGIHYLNANGYLVNTADARGGITTAQYDQFGNNVWALTAGNRTTALGATDAARTVSAKLGISALPSAERAELLATRTVYSGDGLREVQRLSPLHEIQLASDLKDGATTVAAKGGRVNARSLVISQYDEGRPTNGTAIVRNQPTTVTTAAQLPQYPGLLIDPMVSDSTYDWASGTLTKTTIDPNGLALAKTIEYDADGRAVKTTMPASNGADAGATVTAYYTSDGTGLCGGRPEWADLVCTTGPAGAITGAGSNPRQLPTKTTEYGPLGETVKLTETANGVTATTAITLDRAGRAVTTAVTGGIGEPVGTKTTEYDPATGKATKVSSSTGGAVTTVFDRLERQISYTDADGGTTTTRYDALDRPVTVSDSVPSTRTYVYDSATEPRDLPTSMTDSVAGTFTATYDADGSVGEEKLPGGYTMKVAKDTTGVPRERTYTRDSDGLAILRDNTVKSAQDRTVDRTTTAGQTWAQSFEYDTAGRLTTMDERANAVCSRRTYGFDKNTNRTAQTTATGGPGQACSATAPTATTHSYDGADRINDAGYAYDAFGRTTAVPAGTTFGYYTNDRVHQQIAGGHRQTWQIDPTDRIRSWTVESDNAGTWTQTAAKVNHYAGEADSPAWIVEDTAGNLTRNVASLAGGLAATTAKTGGVTLQLVDLHGDVAVQLPLDAASAPTALHNDEFGNPATGQAATRYTWLGSEQRSTETPTGITLMGARLYDPTIGRFLSTDPVPGGGANAYAYCSGDGVNCRDTDGRLDYTFSFPLGWSWKSKEILFMLFRWNFGKIFPLKGRATSIWLSDIGMFMPLRDSIHGIGSINFNVRVGYIGNWSLRLDPTPGSVVMGRNSYILFWIWEDGAPQPDRGFATFNVHGHTAGDTRADRLPKALYKDGAYAAWSKLASNFRSFLRKWCCNTN